MADLLMKNLPLFIIPLIAAYFYFNSTDKLPSSNEIILEKSVVVPLTNKNKTFITKKYPQVPSASVKRFPASAYVKRSPATKIKLALAESPIRIGKSFQVVPNVLSINKNEYQNDFGKIISKNEYFVFFEPKNGFKEAAPTAYNSTNGKLYPISHILHVKGVDAQIRSQLKVQGLNEYYYHSRLKLISLETTAPTVLTQYNRLLSRGFDVRLEVIKEAVEAH